MNIDFTKCLVSWQGHGVRFLYPDIWQLIEQPDGTDIVINVECSATSFWTLRILPDCPPPPQVMESCVTAFRDEYDDIEVDKPTAMLAEMPAVARDLTFFCVELLNSVSLRCVRATDFTLLVWWQGTHHEQAECQAVFEQMTESLRADCLMD